MQQNNLEIKPGTLVYMQCTQFFNRKIGIVINNELWGHGGHLYNIFVDEKIHLFFRTNFGIISNDAR